MRGAVACAVILLLWAMPARADLLFAGNDASGAWGLWHYDQDHGAKLILDREVRGPVGNGNVTVFADPSGRIWIWEDGAEPQEIPDLPRPCDQPTLSPSGQTIVVACFRFANRQDDGALYKIDLNTRKATLLFDGNGLQKSPVFSPDGNRLAFVTGFRLNASRVIEHIWIIDSNGENATEIEAASDVNVDPTWDGNDALVFSSDRAGQGIQLWRKTLDANVMQQISFGEADYAAVVSPSGETAFIGFQDDREALMIISDRSANPIAVNIPNLQSIRDPAWVTGGTK